MGEKLYYKSQPKGTKNTAERFSIIVPTNKQVKLGFTRACRSIDELGKK